MTRPSIPETLAQVALAWSQRSTCSKKAVGAVIASHSGQIISSGYNGAPSGMEHCKHQCGCLSPLRVGTDHWPGCPMSRTCDIAIHAEENAILFAARSGVRTYASMMVTTHAPCARCARMIYACGIDLVQYIHPPSNDNGLNLLAHRGITTRQLKGLKLP